MRRSTVGTLVMATTVAASLATTANGQNALIPSFNAGAGTWAPPANRTVPRILGSPTGVGTAALGGTAAFPMSTMDLRGELVPTDPLVRQIQIGPAPVGQLAEVDLRRGVGVASVPGAGSRVVRTTGAVIRTAAGPAVRVVDASTGVEFLALMPAEALEPTDPGPVVPAKIVKVSGSSVIAEREENGKTLTEIVPSDRVYVAIRGGFVPAASVRRLRPGAEVFIALTGGSRGTISVTRPNGFSTRASSASVAPTRR